MKRYILFLTISLITFVSCGQKKENNTSKFNYQLTEKEWQEKLSPEQYRILRKSGTEKAFTGEF